jgi:hypothetical protein
MAIAALSARSSTQHRAGRRPLPSGTWPAAPLAVLAASNDVPHRPPAAALPGARLAGVAAHTQFEIRPEP